MSNESKQMSRRKHLKTYVKKNKCAYCHGTEDLTVDHKHPLALGGTDTLKNYQTLCKRCNLMKSAIPHGHLKRIFAWYEETKLTRTKPWRLPKMK